MNGILTYLTTIFQSVLVSVETKLASAFSAIITELRIDESDILHDAMSKFTSDRAAGKAYGEAAADALTVFYNEEKGEVSKVGLQLFQAFLAATEGK